MQIVTANRLRDGRVVFRDRSGHWVEEIAEATVLTTVDAAAEVEAANVDVAARLIVEPYAVDVTDGPEGIVPKIMRERIRAGGPTSGSEAAAAASLDRAA